MSDHRSAVRRTTILVAILGAVSGSAALRSAASHRAAASATMVPANVTLPDSIAFDVEYGGIGAEGVDQVWRGRVTGPVPGTVTIRLEYAGAPGDRHMPVWPVNAWLFFCANDYRNSFAAELSGSMNWGSGDMRVTGLVSDGVRRDTPVEQRVRLDKSTLAGPVLVRFIPRLAARGVASGND